MKYPLLLYYALNAIHIKLSSSFFPLLLLHFSFIKCIIETGFHRLILYVLKCNKHNYFV